MLYRKKDLPELHIFNHRHDDGIKYIEYDKEILKNSLSPYLYNNPLMSMFLDKMQPLIAILFDQHNVVKNFKNYIVDKYYYKHSK
jgi:hypothetical protein